MSLVQRKSRPLKRDESSLRDDRLFIVACDDTYAPWQYFDFFRITRVQVHAVPTGHGDCAAPHVLRRLLEFKAGLEKDDELWMPLDTGHYIKGPHAGTFIEAIREARRQGVHAALSRPCFELWLLHHIEESGLSSLACAKDIDGKLRATLSQYNKTNLRREDFPMALVPEACRRAERMDASAGGGDVPEGDTSRVYRLWRAIAAKALPSQLPTALLALLP